MAPTTHKTEVNNKLDFFKQSSFDIKYRSTGLDKGRFRNPVFVSAFAACIHAV